MLKAKMTLLSLSIPEDKIIPRNTGGTIGTDFELQATVKVSKRGAGSLSGEGIDSLELEWIEICDWFEFTGGKWTFKGTKPNNIDMHALNPGAETFKNWRTMRYLYASSDEFGKKPEAGLTKAVQKVEDMEEQNKAAKHWIAANGLEWTIPVAVDRPSIGLRPVAGSGVGAGMSLVTSNSRRRVLYFNLGFKGNSLRETATLILETVNGRPTLNHFATPGISREQANDETNLERWRREFSQANP